MPVPDGSCHPPCCSPIVYGGYIAYISGAALVFMCVATMSETRETLEMDNTGVDMEAVDIEEVLDKDGA